LLKDSTPERMVFEIRSLYCGGSPISPLIARQILMRFRQGDKSAAASAEHISDKQRTALSAREMEVLEFITKGFTSDEIAALMSLSRHTVLTFIRRIYSKLEVNSRTEARGCRAMAVKTIALSWAAAAVVLDALRCCSPGRRAAPFYFG
jgi:DNA-binding NarL/FixJ family response regulator